MNTTMNGDSQNQDDSGQEAADWTIRALPDLPRKPVTSETAKALSRRRTLRGVALIARRIAKD